MKKSRLLWRIFKECNLAVSEGSTRSPCGIRLFDNVPGTQCARFREYDRKPFLIRNYIALNIFMHRRSLFETLGGFDGSLISHEDWDLIIKYTRENPLLVLECCLADYYIDEKLGNLSLEENRLRDYHRVRDRYSKA